MSRKEAESRFPCSFPTFVLWDDPRRIPHTLQKWIAGGPGYTWGLKEGIYRRRWFDRRLQANHLENERTECRSVIEHLPHMHDVMGSILLSVMEGWKGGRVGGRGKSGAWRT